MPVKHGRVSADQDYAAEEQFARAFSFLWAVATPFHMGLEYTWGGGVVQLGLTFFSILTILRPLSLWAFLPFLAFQAADIYRAVPNATNHWILSGFANLIIGITVLHCIFHKREWPMTAASLFRRYASSLRLLVIFFYCFTVLHKLNWGFLDPSASSARFIYSRLAKILPFLPQGEPVGTVVIYLSLLAEAAIPILLVSAKTRPIGILWACVFHYIIGITGFAEFSAPLFALLFLFAPADFPALLGRLDPIRSNVWKWVIALTMAGVGTCLLNTYPDARSLAKMLHYAWAIYGLCGLGLWILWLSGRQRAAYPHRGFFTPRLAIHFGVFPLVFMQAMSPYLGLSTCWAFNMYSDLSTEAGRTNHLFMPNIQIFGYQMDLVEVLGSSDRLIQYAADNCLLFTHHSLRAYVSKKVQQGKPIQLRYRRNNQEREIINASEDPEWAIPPPYLPRKLLKFRMIPTDTAGVRRCASGPTRNYSPVLCP